ncbi:MAG: ATP-binding protein [Candidatus Heimdallarchaeaceae archaeon]
MIIQNPLKLIVFGPTGHGKTTLLASATKMKDQRLAPTLLLDFEAGVQSIESLVHKISLEDLANKKVKPSVDRVDVVKIKSWSDFDIVYEYLATNEDNPYRSVALDSLSEMNYLNLTSIVETGVQTNPRHDPDIAYQDDYLKSAAQMRKLIRYFRDLPMHVFFSAAVKQMTDPRTKQTQYWPSLIGQLALEIPGLLTIVGYLAVVTEVKEGQEVQYRALFTQPTEGIIAKDRTEGGKLGGMVVEPTLPKILDLVSK